MVVPGSHDIGSFLKTPSPPFCNGAGSSPLPREERGYALLNFGYHIQMGTERDDPDRMIER